MKNVFALYLPFELNKNNFIFAILKIVEIIIKINPKTLKMIPEVWISLRNKIITRPAINIIMPVIKLKYLIE